MNTTGRSDSSALVQALARLPFRRRRWSPTPVPAHALELRTHVGQTHSRWTSTPRRSPTPVPISNVRTQLSRLWAGADAGVQLSRLWAGARTGAPRRSRPGADAGVRLPPRRTRWSYVRTLDKRTAVGDPRPADLQRTYRSPTHVPNSHGCGPATRESTPARPRQQKSVRAQHFTHQNVAAKSSRIANPRPGQPALRDPAQPGRWWRWSPPPTPPAPNSKNP